ncbi:uncharacterized protein LOC106646427, partial [Copidosoma floridanum]
MEVFETLNNEMLEQMIERANTICIEPIKYHWNGTLFSGKSDTKDDLKLDDLRFKLGFDHIELVNSTMEEEPFSSLISSIGNLKMLAMAFIFKLPDIKINGTIRMCSVLRKALESTYKLHLTKVKVKSVISLYIAQDNYCVYNVIHEFLHASISLMYKQDTEMVPVYSKIQDQHIKHSLAQYIVQSCTKKTIDKIEKKLRTAFDMMSVSASFNSFPYRDMFRDHTDKMKLVVDKLVDEIIDSTNLLLVTKKPTIILPNISVILNFKKDDKKSFKASKNFLTGYNFLLRKKSPCVTLENDLVVLYVPVDFADLTFEYKHANLKYGQKETRSVNIIEHYKTEGSYLTLSLRRLKGDKVDLNLLEFKIVDFIYLDSENQSYIDPFLRTWINSVLEFQVAPLIENTFEKYLRSILEQEKFNFSG